MPVPFNCHDLVSHKHGDHHHAFVEAGTLISALIPAEKQERPTSIARKRAESTLVNRINPTNKHDRVKNPFRTPEKNDWYVGKGKRDGERENEVAIGHRVKCERSLVTTRTLAEDDYAATI